MPRTPSYRLHQGFRMPLGFPAEAFVSARSYRAQPDDLFITAYPKCGTTWTQQMLYAILHDGTPLPMHQKISDFIPHLEEVGAHAVLSMKPPRIIKTHLPLAMIPCEPQAKYVYLARNPFDCAVSFYHHTRGFPQHYDFAEGSFEDFFECFLSGEVDFGGYFDHLVPWCEHRCESNVLFMTYEEMKQEPAAALRALGRFMGAAGAAVEDETALARMIEGSSFKRMSAEQSRWSSARAVGAAPFVRKGSVGDWMNYFTAAQARRLAHVFRERTRGTHAATLWETILDEAEHWQPV